MKISIPKTAIEHGILKVAIKNIPAESGVVKAYRITDSGQLSEEIGIAYLYGKGDNSIADEKAILQFRIHHNLLSPLRTGELTEICLVDSLTGMSSPTSFNVIEVY
jgi:hypothetical protein